MNAKHYSVEDKKMMIKEFYIYLKVLNWDFYHTELNENDFLETLIEDKDLVNRIKEFITSVTSESCYLLERLDAEVPNIIYEDYDEDDDEF